MCWATILPVVGLSTSGAPQSSGAAAAYYATAAAVLMAADIEFWSPTVDIQQKQRKTAASNQRTSAGVLSV